ncbi:hypothetical protein AYO37_01015 [Opitutia bacterium SCGC AG-212-L18]|nr:hypothetical protein AYO37_01015 [Opitutae bacterium SCGC AG-212-L18]
MIPIYSFPTTILFLDDDINYLKHLSLHLPHDRFSFRLYNNPEKAFDYILTNYKTTSDQKNYWRPADPIHLDSHVVEINIPILYQKCFDQNRFHALSTVIIDYDMPSINGLDFLEKIQFPGIQKILLTGEADAHVAVEAFNKGLIDQYLRKQDPNLETLLINAISKSQTCYFEHLSFPLIDALSHNTNHPSALLEKEFENYFYETLKSNNIIESYLLDTVGSYLMLTSSNKIIILHIQNEDQTKSYYLDIEGLDPEYFTDEEKASIKNGDKIFCYRSFNEQRHPDPTLWKQYYLNAQRIKGNNKFYCSIEKDSKNLDLKKINSFNLYTKHRRSVFE